MLDFGFYNMDCLQGMKEFPDKYFDLAIVDPPYGGGFTEGGGCQGWFSKYHQTITNDIGGGGASEDGLIATKRTTRPVERKKSYRGTRRQNRSILTSCLGSHVTRSSGAETILLCHRAGVFWYGAN